MGYGDLTITGASGYNTPTIDRLASERVAPASNLPNKLRHPALPLIDGNEKIRELWTLDDQAELTTLYMERNDPIYQKES